MKTVKLEMNIYIVKNTDMEIVAPMGQLPLFNLRTLDLYFMKLQNAPTNNALSKCCTVNKCMYYCHKS